VQVVHYCRCLLGKPPRHLLGVSDQQQLSDESLALLDGIQLMSEMHKCDPHIQASV